MFKGKDSFIFFLSACTVIILAFFTIFVLPHVDIPRSEVAASSSYR